MRIRWLWCLALLAVLPGCASVTASSISPKEYLAERRGDVLTSGRLSAAAREVLRVVGIEDCQDNPLPCRETLRNAMGVTEEQRLSTLSELWLEAALHAEQQDRTDPAGPTEASLRSWLEVARHAYAYLFFTSQRSGGRAFEDRQTQVRDYYNYAVQQSIAQLFRSYRDVSLSGISDMQKRLGWRIWASRPGHPREALGELPVELIAASSLRFSGVRNTYRRDGLGAELIAVNAAPAKEVADVTPYAETRYPAFTALLRFEGKTLAEILSTREAEVLLFDPYRNTEVQLAGEKVPLAANFTAGYGLWLARSGFALQSLRTLLGSADGIVRPRIQLMQTFDPDRRIVVMLHGLASSPEAWVNVANEISGDERLRQNYQIWQVYYPTNAPLALNLRMIRDALEQTLAHFDPGGKTVASHQMTLIGHSMGGVLARLLVSSSNGNLLDALPSTIDDAQTARQLRERLAPYSVFEPLPQVTGAIFIAAPHRGTPFAQQRLARYLANLITLPATLLEPLGDLTGLIKLPGYSSDASAAPIQRIPNSIDNLSDQDAFVRAAAVLPISRNVIYHSIMGRSNLKAPLALSSDGIVPYDSAHLDGAASEFVTDSNHSVQENPKAILEIRRILAEQLR